MHELCTSGRKHKTLKYDNLVHIVMNILRGGDIAGVASFGGGDVTKMAATRKQKNAIISGNIRPIAIL